MDSEGSAGGLNYGGVAICMIEVGVRVENIADCQSQPLDLSHYAIWMPSWIDDRSFLCVRTADDVAVGLDQSDGQR